MSIRQVSVFTQSQPGHLKRILATLRESQINLRGYSCSDSGDFGIARFIVDKPEAAELALGGAGFAVATTEVLCIQLKDQPGELERVIGLIADADMNVLYSYSLISTNIAIRVEGIADAEKVLTEAGVSLVSQGDLA